MESILQYISIASGIIITMSVGRLNLYFREYDAPIFNLIVFSDIVTYSLDLVYNLCPLFFATGIGYFFLLKHSNWLPTSESHTYIVIIWIIFVVSVFGAIYSSRSFKERAKYIVPTLCTYTAIACLFFLNYCYNAPNQNLSIFFDKKVDIFLIFSFAFFYVRIDSKYAVYMLNNSGIKGVSIITFKDKNQHPHQLKTNHDRYIIGILTNFVLIYHQKIKKTEIIPMDVIESIKRPNLNKK